METYKRKMNSGTAPKETYMEAAKEVLVKSSSLRKASASEPDGNTGSANKSGWIMTLYFSWNIS
jgi:hypothetical protein